MPASTGASGVEIIAAGDKEYQKYIERRPVRPPLSFYSFTKAALFGGGTTDPIPLIPFHNISLKTSSGTRSSCVKSRPADLFASSFQAIFFSSRSILAGRQW